MGKRRLRMETIVRVMGGVRCGSEGGEVGLALSNQAVVSAEDGGGAGGGWEARWGRPDGRGIWLVIGWSGRSAGRLVKSAMRQ